MEVPVRFIYLAQGIFALVLLILTVWLFKHDKLRRREFFLWLSTSVAIIFMAAVPRTLSAVASLLGVQYTYVAVLVIGFTFFLFLSLYMFTELSYLNGRLVKIAQRLAILEHYSHEKRDAKKAK